MAYILVIEDDVASREEVRDFLLRRLHTVRDVGRIAEARLAIDERAPDLVISDINLPDGDGAAFCVEQAPRYPNTRWLLMSGDPGAVHRGRQLKIDNDAPPFSVLSKPVSLRMLDDFVRLATTQSRPTTA